MTLSRNLPKQYILRDIWLLLVATGGWWRPSEVRDRLGMAAVRGQAMHALHDNYRRGYFERRVREMPKGERSQKMGVRMYPEYRVTKACRIPEGVTLEMLLNALDRGVAPASRDESVTVVVDEAAT